MKTNLYQYLLPIKRIRIDDLMHLYEYQKEFGFKADDLLSYKSLDNIMH